MKKNNVPCLLNLYDRCIVVENCRELIHSYGSMNWIKNVCTICIKAYRLRLGLKYVHEYHGLRTGVTL